MDAITRRFQAAVRMAQVQAPVVPIVAELIRRSPGTISLGQGVVRYGPPPAAIAAAKAALETHAPHEYGAVDGMDALIQTLAVKLQRENRIPLRDRGIMVTAGANLGFLQALLAIADAGDEIILPVPYYFNHEMAVAMLGCRAVGVPTDGAYRLRVEAIAAAVTPRTRAIVTVSPNNPSGTVYSDEELAAVNRLCGERGLYHISDEVYEYFVYDGVRHASAAATPGSEPHTISLFSFSKAFGLAGWRVGYMVVPEPLMPAFRKIQDTTLVCPPLVSQIAAHAAADIGREYCTPFVESLARVRRRVLASLAELGERCVTPTPDGAFYVLPRVRTSLHPRTVVERLIVEHKVAVLPGDTFGLQDGCALRVAYGALDEATVSEGIGRLVEGIRRITA